MSIEDVTWRFTIDIFPKHRKKHFLILLEIISIAIIAVIIITFTPGLRSATTTISTRLSGLLNVSFSAQWCSTALFLVKIILVGTTKHKNNETNFHKDIFPLWMQCAITAEQWQQFAVYASEAKSVNGAEQHPGRICVQFRSSLLRKEDFKQKYLQRRPIRILGRKESLSFWKTLRKLGLVKTV